MTIYDNLPDVTLYAEALNVRCLTLLQTIDVVLRFPVLVSYEYSQGLSL